MKQRAKNSDRPCFMCQMGQEDRPPAGTAGKFRKVCLALKWQSSCLSCLHSPAPFLISHSPSLLLPLLLPSRKPCCPVRDAFPGCTPHSSRPYFSYDEGHKAWSSLSQGLLSFSFLIALSIPHLFVFIFMFF